MPSPDICCLCSLEAPQSLRLGCDHSYCQSCLHRINSLAESPDRMICPICLKTSRQSFPHKNKPLPWEYSRGGTANRRQSTKDKLYCFTCQQLFPTNDYINGSHRGHRVKVQDEANSELQEEHLRSLRVLQGKMEDCLRKEGIMHSHLDTTQRHYDSLKEEVQNYFDSLILTVEEQRDHKIRELQEIYNSVVDKMVEEIQDIQRSMKSTKECGSVLKSFCNGEVSIEELHRATRNLKDYLEIKSYKIQPLLLPKIIESSDLCFLIKNCLSFIPDQELPKEQSIISSTKSEVETEVQLQVQPSPLRKVRLVQKLRNQMNNSCKLLRDDCFMFQF